MRRVFRCGAADSPGSLSQDELKALLAGVSTAAESADFDHDINPDPRELARQLQVLRRDYNRLTRWLSRNFENWRNENGDRTEH